MGTRVLTESMKDIPDQPTMTLARRLTTTEHALVFWRLHVELDMRNMPPCLRPRALCRPPQIAFLETLADFLWLANRHPGHKVAHQRLRGIFRYEPLSEQWHRAALWVSLGSSISLGGQVANEFFASTMHWRSANSLTAQLRQWYSLQGVAMSLSKLVSFVEDGPWCGTRPPGFHPPRPGQIEAILRASLADEVTINPQPLPPRTETAAFLWQAIRLHQYGQILANAKVGGSVTEALFQRSTEIYDDGWCGSVPWQVLLQWLRNPPPPPPPWLELIGQAVTNVLIGGRMGGEFGKQLNTAAAAVIVEHLGERNRAQ